MRDIKELRNEIDGIDKQLVKLFERRMSIVEEVASFKLANNLPLKDENREDALIKKNVALLENEKYNNLLKVFFKDIMEYSRIHQNELMRNNVEIVQKSYENVRVAYQGIEGSFSSIALTKYFGDNVQKLNVLNFEDAFKLLQNEDAEFIILPIENSSTGAINEVYDLLKKYYASIVGEIYIPIEHNLIGTKDATIDTITEVYSHEQGFKQSSSFLSDYNWKQYTYFNTAKSVEHVGNMNRSDFAAIGSKEAAEYYGLEIIETSIQDNNDNSTRFIVLSQKSIKDENANKISLIIKVSHEPKSLFKVLEKISDYNVNMLKIESRPVNDKPWEYLFYLDIEGSVDDQVIKDLLEEIEDVSNYMLLLGNYYSDKCKNWRK